MSAIGQIFKRSYTGKITVAYIGVLVLLAVIASGRLYISQAIEVQQASSAAEINVSGRQRMLSQRIALYGTRMVQAAASEDIAAARKKMLDATSLMEQSHDALVNGDDGFGVEAPVSDALRGLYFDGDPSLDKDLRGFVATAKHLSKDSRNFLLLDRLVSLSGDILPRLDAVVAQYQKESEDAILRLRNISNAFYASMLLILMLSGLFVFRPIVRRLKDMIEGQVRNAEHLKALNADLEKASKAKNEFLSSMSHELRTPLNAIMGFAQLLETDDLDKSQQESVRHILKGGNHLLSLVNDVLDLEGISSGKVSLSMEDVHPAQPLAECLNMAQFMAKKYDVMVEGGPFADDLPYVRVDQTRFKQILLNFLSNAVKYNREHGRVDLTVDVADQYLRVTISDTGPGIPEKKQKKLFVPFERLGMEGSVVEGTGIGLAITKELLELMGGRVGFVSEEGKGSSFWFEVPLATHLRSADDRKTAADTQEDVPARTLSVGNKTILCIEDNPGNLLVIETLFQRYPEIRLITAISGEDGVRLAEMETPDLLLIDINLPNMNGREVLAALRRKDATRNIPAIALSAAATAVDIERGMDAGFVEYVIKPIVVNDLLDSVERALGGN